MTKKDFYSNGRGDRLIDPLFYPKGIKLFLENEEKLLVSLAPFFDLLIEVGCMNGRYLSWAMGYKKAYFGLDIVERYIDAGNKRLGKLKTPKAQCQFVLGSAEDIASIIRPDDLGVKTGRCLAFFPFNSFGNMPNPEPVIKSLGESNLPFCISSYRISKKATECRKRYYKNCGYSRIRTSRSRRGVRFSSPDGLSTIAYDPAFLREMFATNNVDVVSMPFSQIGMAYLSSKLFMAVNS